MKYYWGWSNSDVTYEIVTKRWGQFCLLGGVIYLYHISFSMAGVNAFADYTRKIDCGTGFESADPIERGEHFSSILDTGIALVTIYHIIEWIKWTLLLTGALVEVNLIKAISFIGVVNGIYGLIVMVMGVIVRYSGDGSLCAEAGKQETRALYLTLQILCLILSPLFSFAHVLYMMMRGNDWCHAVYLEKDDDEDD